MVVGWHVDDNKSIKIISGIIIMERRFSTDPVSVKRMTTDELRKFFLIDNLFVPDKVPMVYSDIDRSITGSAVPVSKKLTLLASKKEMGVECFMERREIGIINIGKEGRILTENKDYRMRHKDVLYIGKGEKEIAFTSKEKAKPAMFYFVSYPAHESFPTTHASTRDAESVSLGSNKGANRRTINKYIHPNGIKSAQLVMGLTELEQGSVWNTMPPHTHQRRSEVYMYFNLGEEDIVFHIMGEPDSTKHIIIRNQQAVLSPSWSVHAGVATKTYSFIWAMGGENQLFDDMDGVKLTGIA
jgi:4-deoxy-L-threo-5-hexosulose-uronate ketol-isomerase